MTTLDSAIAVLGTSGAFLAPVAPFEKRTLALGDLAARGVLLPADYQELWQHCDGLQFAGVFLFGSAALAPENGHEALPGIVAQNDMRAGRLPKGQALVGKATGNLWLTVSSKEGLYRVLDAASLDEFAVFQGLSGLLETLLNKGRLC